MKSIQLLKNPIKERNKPSRVGRRTPGWQNDVEYKRNSLGISDTGDIQVGSYENVSLGVIENLFIQKSSR